MKQTLTTWLIIFLFTFAAFAQKLAKPTKSPVPPTPAQQKIIQEGVALHDTKKFEEAIAKYQTVLAENPDCTVAMYEMAMSLYAKGDKEKALETANRGSNYISDELPLFYVVMANIIDDVGKPDEAIKIYQTGLKLLSGDTQFVKYRASLSYNLGVTYVEQKKYIEARQVLKNAVEDDFNYASPHFLLSLVYNGTKYKIPAFLAASRFVSLEYNSDRTGEGAAVIADVLKPASPDPKTGNINISINIDAPKDEGDLSMYELFLGTLTTVKGKDDEKKSSNERFIDGISALIALLSEDKKLASTFVGKNYIPFMVEMKKNGYVEPFGYMVLYINGASGADKWLQTNDAKLSSFLKWAKEYKRR